MDNYADYIDPDLLETYQNNVEYSSKLRENDFSILEQKYTYVDTSSVYQLPPYQHMIDTMYNRVNEIKQLNDPFKQEEKKDVVPGIIWV